jgi:UDP-glucuronate 4-epimerase
VLEGCRHAKTPHLVFASSSSVYGANGKQPFSEGDGADHPVSLYAASKKANELMAHTYASLYGLPVTGLRFFTVYGPWGRPDMSPFQFVSKILAGEPIQVFSHGKHRRDFTYIDDIVEGIVRVMARPPTGNEHWDVLRPDPGTSRAPYVLYNLGNGSPEDLIDYIRAIEAACGRQALMEMLPQQPGDVAATFADTTRLMRDTGYAPSTPLRVGIQRFVDWYRDYYSL